MSKIGNLPILIPEGVEITVEDKQVLVSGPKGKLLQGVLSGIEVNQESNQVILSRKNDADKTRAFHGLMRSLLQGMVTGVTEGWSKNLELVGTGYRAALQGKKLVLNVGYSHPIEIEAPEGVDFKVDGQNKVTVEGFDKQLVGEIAARVRRARPPEPYKGKGIKHEGERIRRKAGKAASTGGAG